MGGRRLKYLELGVSVGKTFVQMAASMSSSTLATIEVYNKNRNNKTKNIHNKQNNNNKKTH